LKASIYENHESLSLLTKEKYSDNLRRALHDDKTLNSQSSLAELIKLFPNHGMNHSQITSQINNFSLNLSVKLIKLFNKEVKEKGCNINPVKVSNETDLNIFSLDQVNIKNDCVILHHERELNLFQ